MSSREKKKHQSLYDKVSEIYSKHNILNINIWIVIIFCILAIGWAAVAKSKEYAVDITSWLGLGVLLCLAFTVLFSATGDILSFFSFFITLGLSKQNDTILANIRNTLDEVKDYTKQLQSYAYGPYEVMESLEEFLKGYKEGDYAYIMTDTLSMVYLYEETYLKDKAWMIDKKISLEKFKKRIRSVEGLIQELPNKTQNMVHYAVLETDENSLGEYIKILTKEILETNTPDLVLPSSSEIINNITSQLDDLKGILEAKIRNQLPNINDTIWNEMKGTILSKIDKLHFHAYIRVCKDFKEFQIFEIPIGNFNIEEYKTTPSNIIKKEKIVKSRVSYFETLTGIDKEDSYYRTNRLFRTLYNSKNASSS